MLWFIQEKLKSNAVNVGAGIVLLGIPLMMGFQNYNPHDRSNRYTAYDYSYSTLKSLPKNDILFVYGDNDTYPIWGMQETSGLRDDVKAVSYTHLDVYKRQVFVIAFFTYLSTIEPNFSFWDCSEYIASAVKLEVTHAPGAALFQLVEAVAAMFALSLIHI